jgi:predicted transcriptional regulator
VEDRLRAEVSIAPSEAKHEVVEASGLNGLADATSDAALNPEVQALIARCMEGTEPLPQGVLRKTWENEKFNSRNVQVVMLRAAGFKQNEIAGMLDISPAWVSTTLAHPYAKKILYALLPHQGARVINIRTRLEEQSGELMDHLFGLAMKSEEIDDVKEVTFGFLDRAGYNPVAKSATAVGRPGDFVSQASSKEISRLADAMDESNSITSDIMPNFKPHAPPETATESLGFATFEEVSASEDRSVGTSQEETSVSRHRASDAEGSQAQTPSR